MTDKPNLPPGAVLDPACEQVLAHRGIWWVILENGQRTAWNGDDALNCPVCLGDPELMPDCTDCAGRGLISHIPFCARPRDEVIPNLWLGGHDCQPAGTEDGTGDCLITEEDGFDLVVSLYQRRLWDFKLGDKVVDERFQPPEGVEHIFYRMADSDLDAEHHTVLDDMAERVADAIGTGKKVLVRCQAGINRSSLVAGLAMMRLGHSADGAIKLMRDARSPYVLFNQSFVAHLKRVEEKKESA